MTPLEKASVIEDQFDAAVAHLGLWFKAPQLKEQLLATAKARHILGHYEYGDTNLFEWSDGKVQAAILEELADAIVYQSWLLEREEQRGGSE